MLMANCTNMKQASCVRLSDFCMSQIRKALLRGKRPASALRVRGESMSRGRRQQRK